MITTRTARQCGQADYGWLQARYTFSFGHYFDPKLLGYASLRVLNQEVLAGAWERLEQGRADIVIAPDMHFRSSSEINSRKLYTLMNVYVAAPDHPIHQEPEPLSEVTRVKYRGIAVADTARERPVLTVQLLDKQPRLTVSTIEDKRQALLAGLGVATMPYPMVEKDIAEGRLRVVSPESTSEIDIIMAWRRVSMGEAKSWCLREIPKLFSGK